MRVRPPRCERPWVADVDDVGDLESGEGPGGKGERREGIANEEGAVRLRIPVPEALPTPRLEPVNQDGPDQISAELSCPRRNRAFSPTRSRNEVDRAAPLELAEDRACSHASRFIWFVREARDTGEAESAFVGGAGGGHR